MALRGNLSDFSLPDVFQLVQLSRKTGVLRIHKDGAEGSVWFREGDVFFAQSNWHRELLGHRLVAAGRITTAALAKALEIRRTEPSGGRRLGAILVDEGYISQNVLEAFVQEQIQDTIFDLMRWDSGHFDFEVLPEAVDEDIGLTVSIENIVMEGSRRIEEWNRIRKKVPSTDMVFKMATAPGEGTFEIALKPTEWNLLLKMDGTRTVGELASSLGKTDFEVARIIYGLFSAGLLEVATDEQVAQLKAEQAERAARRQAIAAEEPKAEAGLEPQVEVEPESAPEPESEPEPEPEEEPEEEPETEPESAIEPEPEEEPEEEPETEPESAIEPEPEPEPEPEQQPEPEPDIEPEPEPEPADTSWVDFRFEPTTPPPAAQPIEAAASAEDQSVFEQMIEQALPPQIPEDMPSEPVVVVEYGDAVNEVEAILVTEPEPEPEREPEPEPDIEPELVFRPLEPVEEVAPPPEPPRPAPFVRTGDFEHDLMAFGLGELPPELLEQRQSQSAQGRPAAAPPVKILSTDVYLQDLEVDASLANALGDEIAALTGGAESTRNRPVAQVGWVPDTDSAMVIRRDEAVDASIVRAIIDGIEKL